MSHEAQLSCHTLFVSGVDEAVHLQEISLGLAVSSLLEAQAIPRAQDFVFNQHPSHPTILPSIFNTSTLSGFITFDIYSYLLIF